MSLNELARRIRVNNVAKGFWDKERNFGEMIALAHSELSEALEAHREDKDPVYYVLKAGENNQPPKPEGHVIELIDCIIRCIDTIGPDYDIDTLLDEKLKYNESRPRMHGKEY